MKIPEIDICLDSESRSGHAGPEHPVSDNKVSLNYASPVRSIAPTAADIPVKLAERPVSSFDKSGGIAHRNRRRYYRNPFRVLLFLLLSSSGFSSCLKWLAGLRYLNVPSSLPFGRRVVPPPPVVSYPLSSNPFGSSPEPQT